MTGGMSAEMRGKLTDLLLGELEPAQDKALRERVRTEPALQRELQELEALFGLMRRGEQIEANPAAHEAIMREARRMTRPSLLQRLSALPELFRFRFRQSRAFRVAAVSLGVHLLAVAVLWQISIGGATNSEFGITEIGFNPSDEVPEYRPDRDFVFRLGHARLSRSVRLRHYGVDGQRNDIRTGVRALMERQQRDGSFGGLGDTGRAALVLLAEGANSSDTTERGAAVRKAIASIRRDVDEGGIDGFALAALIEDWALSYEQLTEEQRANYVRAILTLLPGVTGPGAGESLVLADLAGFPISANQQTTLAPDGAGLVLKGDVRGAMQTAADRVNATAVVSRMHDERADKLTVARDDVRAWLRPLFLGAQDQARNGNAAALLTLQAPYRL